MASRRIHLGMHIEGSLKRRDLTGMLADDGKELSDAEVREVLMAERARGHTVFVGAECNNRKANGACAGHPDNQKEQDDG